MSSLRRSGESLKEFTRTATAREVARRAPVDRFTSDVPRAASTGFSSAGGKEGNDTNPKRERGLRDPTEFPDSLTTFT